MLLGFKNEVNFLCRQQNTKPLKISVNYYIMLSLKLSLFDPT